MLTERQWAWADLAEEMGITAGRMSHIVSSDIRVNIQTIERIAQALEVEPTDFDLYIVKKLPEYAVSAPGLIEIGRSLATAKNMTQFARAAAKIA
jgi:DNA-binding Xre family transcriptional regulator